MGHDLNPVFMSVLAGVGPGWGQLRLPLYLYLCHAFHSSTLKQDLNATRTTDARKCIRQLEAVHLEAAATARQLQDIIRKHHDSV